MTLNDKLIIKIGHVKSVKPTSVTILYKKTEEGLYETQQYRNGDNDGKVETATSSS